VFGPEETTDPVKADERNFYKVERWTADDHIAEMLYAGSSLDRARHVFKQAIDQRPKGRFT
jgi:hypothetical protein